MKYRLLACAGTMAAATFAPAALPAQATPDSVPQGHGRLSGEVIAVLLDANTVQFRMTPLHQQIIELLKPDVYEPLRKLGVMMGPEISEAARRYGVSEPTVFYVTAYGQQDQAVFTPENISITNRSRYFRPIAIIPMSPQWSQYRLKQRETASAIFVFEEGIEVWEPMVIEYGPVISNQWAQILPALERERAWVRSQVNRQN